MHDPKTVAIDIPRPWPKRWPGDDAKPGQARWVFRYSWARWYDLRPRVFRRFTVVAGRGLYWPNFITIWHNEPGGRDSGEVCKHITRWRDADGEWQGKTKRAWRWHVHHWSIQFHPWQKFRRWAFTRCEWCGGPSRKGDVVNHSKSWGREPGRFWQGERGLYHSDCATVSGAHLTCICGVGPWESGDYGRCANCDRFKAWRKEPQPERDDLTRALRTIPEGTRDRETCDRAVAAFAKVSR